MNQLETHQPQIQKTDIGYTIEVDSTMKRLSYQVTPTMLFISTIVLFISTMLSEVLAMILFLGLLIEIFIYLYKYLFASNITIANARIQQGEKIIQLNNIPYLDIHVKVIPDNVQVRIQNIKFKLNDAANIPILTDILEKTANVVFYDNHQLSDGSEVLTFKGKHITTPTFSTFLTIQNQLNTIRIYDMTNQFSWIEIHKNNATAIHYSKPKGDEYIVGSISLSNIEKLHIIIDNRASLTKQYRQVSLLAIEKIAVQSQILNTYNTYFKPTNYSYIFHSQLRSAKDELTNMRDGEKIYDLLKSLPSLKHIKIEKIIKN